MPTGRRRSRLSRGSYTRALADMFGEEPVQIRTMGSTVAISGVVEVMGAPGILIPTANVDANQYGENENLRLENLFTAIRTVAALLTM
jgi:hypothetical protein